MEERKEDLHALEAEHINPFTGENEVKQETTQDQPKQSKPLVNQTPKEPDLTRPHTWGKVGRNQECPCGSGKKYKNCHGKIQ